MRTFKTSSSIERILNHYQGEIMDCVEGCLIDNYLISTPQGAIMLKETYQNCWTSIYTVYMSNDSIEIYGMWEAFVNDSEQVKGEA